MYTLTNVDVGATLRVRVTASNSAGSARLDLGPHGGDRRRDHDDDDHHSDSTGDGLSGEERLR